MADDIVIRLVVNANAIEWEQPLSAERHREAAEEIKRLRAESAEDEALREQMAQILHATAVALHGGPLVNGLWSWHDVPERAERLRAAGDALAHLMPHAHLSVPCRPPHGTPLDDWCSECAALAARKEARRER